MFNDADVKMLQGDHYLHLFTGSYSGDDIGG